MFELPSTARRTSHDETTYKKIWLYGQPFSGKTTFADSFPKPLMLNTDGNVKFVTAPFMSMKNTSIWDGRVEHKYMAWEVFKETIKKLKEDADKGKADRFQSIVIDLAEHLKESCRLYMFEQMGIKHESDDPFRSYDKIRTEYCSTMRELLSLPYNMIIVSHEDTTRDIMKRGGDKITSIRPNIDEKTANYLAGLVDIVGRCVVVDGEYRISFKSDEVVFGGGRIPLTVKEIPNDYKTFMKVVYGENESELPLFAEEVKVEIEPTPEPVAAPVVEEKPLEAPVVEEKPAEEPVRRTRRVRSTN